MSTRNTALGTLQRDALVIAHHGPLGACKGMKAQAKALVAKGYLTVDLLPTSKGIDAYREMAAPKVWGQGGVIPRWALPSYFGTFSADHETVYVTTYGNRSTPQAFRASSIPADIRVALGVEMVETIEVAS